MLAVRGQSTSRFFSNSRNDSGARSQVREWRSTPRLRPPPKRSQLSQNQLLLLFSGEAYNIEMGITNELFQIEREENPNCQFATVPNDVTQNVCQIGATENFKLSDSPAPRTGPLLGQHVALPERGVR